MLAHWYPQDRVRHAKMGDGTIVSHDRTGRDAWLVSFDNACFQQFTLVDQGELVRIEKRR